ncbi:MAG: amidase family protein [Gammaproteobacteria bacterium]|nr:amidase family protein [Gammaproteobacteria bacterium]
MRSSSRSGFHRWRRNQRPGPRLPPRKQRPVHRNTFPSRADEYGDLFKQFLQSGHEASAADLANATFSRKRANGKIAPLFGNIDLLVSPTLVAESFPYDPSDAYGGIDAKGTSWAGVPFDWFNRNARFISIWDFNGYPTLSVPCGFSPAGLPLSLQLIAKPLDEALLCRAGHAFEQANDFHQRHPVD